MTAMALQQLAIAAWTVASMASIAQAASHRLSLQRLPFGDREANSSLAKLVHRRRQEFAPGGWDPVKEASTAWPVALLDNNGAALSWFRTPLRNNFDLLYTLTAQVGTPAVPVRLIMDTGSSDLWVKSSSLLAPYGAVFSNGAVYDRQKSSTADTSGGEQVTITYGQGLVIGVEVRDRVCLEQLCIQNQSFIFAEDVLGIPDQWLFDGILGLGYPMLALDRTPLARASWLSGN